MTENAFYPLQACTYQVANNLLEMDPLWCAASWEWEHQTHTTHTHAQPLAYCVWKTENKKMEKSGR